jgi:catechol-2,3-dioxygenase
MAANVEMLLASAQPKMKNFYQRILGFSIVGEHRHYPPGNQPILLLSREMAMTSPARSRLNPFFHIAGDEVDDMLKIIGPLLALRR